MKSPLLALALLVPSTALGMKPAASGKQAAHEPDSAEAAKGEKSFTGKRVDLDFRDADVHNVLRLLGDVGQVDIVTTDDVKGTLTMKMRDVPWDRALEIVLRGKKLSHERDGNTIRVFKKPNR